MLVADDEQLAFANSKTISIGKHKRDEQRRKNDYRLYPAPFDQSHVWPTS